MENQTITTSSSSSTDAWTMYIYSLKSPLSEQKYPKRLAKFFAFAGLPQDISIEEQSKMFVAKATTAAEGGDTNWAFNTTLEFVMAQLEQEIAKLKAQSGQADLYKQRYAEMRLSLDEKDEAIRAIKEQVHQMYKELYQAGIIQRIPLTWRFNHKDKRATL